MGRPPVIPPDQKTLMVLSILAREVSIAEDARKEKVAACGRVLGMWWPKRRPTCPEPLCVRGSFTQE